MRFIALRSGAQSEDAASNGCLRNYDVSRVVLDIVLTLDRIKRLEALEQARRAASPTSRPIIASFSPLQAPCALHLAAEQTRPRCRQGPQ
jgi:hypothetical protein